MLELKESLILYHGSYCEVSRPDLRKCAEYSGLFYTIVPARGYR